MYRRGEETEGRKGRRTQSKSPSDAEEWFWYRNNEVKLKWNLIAYQKIERKTDAKL